MTALETIAHYALVTFDVPTVVVANAIPPCFRSPFDSGVGCDWENRLLFTRPRLPARRAVGLLHELGHIVTCKRPPDRSSDASFFGWEYLVAEKLGLKRAWLDSNYTFGIDSYTAFGELSPARAIAYIERWIRHGQRYGFISPERCPLSVR